VSDWACVKLTTIGESCRALLRELIRTMIGWVVEQIETVAQTKGNVTKRLNEILRHLNLGTLSQ
jgi:hypothetical protein